VHLVRAQGVWLFDAEGNRLLDAYNNVPVVGHCHPRVTEAVVRQTRLLNTHSRYLYEPLVELAERLVATMPPETGLDAVMLVNSGSEANDLAWRLATTATGHSGAIVTEFAYHGAGRGRFIHPKRPRTITPREAARLQGFPDWFDFIGTEMPARRDLAKWIGNAVPTVLGHLAGLAALSGRAVPSD
jgi:acetylornithine/succinyldiaminopimelate/putrescine aminotransferase